MLSPFRPASDGETYVLVGVGLLFPEPLSQTLCSPIPAGTTASFTVDLATSPGLAGPAPLQIYGDSIECGQRELLWESPRGDGDWTTHCVTLSPTQDVTALTLVAVENSGSPVLVDHIVPVSGCP